jgi:hypothetical protein
MDKQQPPTPQNGAALRDGATGLEYPLPLSWADEMEILDLIGLTEFPDSPAAICALSAGRFTEVAAAPAPARAEPPPESPLGLGDVFSEPGPTPESAAAKFDAEFDVVRLGPDLRAEFFSFLATLGFVGPNGLAKVPSRGAGTFFRVFWARREERLAARQRAEAEAAVAAAAAAAQEAEEAEADEANEVIWDGIIAVNKPVRLAYEKHPALHNCKHCTNFENVRYNGGNLVEFFCESCCLIIASDPANRCRGGHREVCLGRRWVDPLGIIAPLCAGCHGREEQRRKRATQRGRGRRVAAK